MTIVISRFGHEVLRLRLKRLPTRIEQDKININVKDLLRGKVT